MKFINLVFQGIANQTASVNLDNKIQGGIAITELDKNTLKDAISFALFGSTEDTTKLTCQTKVELSFSEEDAVYTIVRTYGIAEGQLEPTEYAVVSNEEQTPIAEGVAEVNAFLAKVVQFTQSAFNALFYVDKAELAEVLCADSLTRESFLAVALNGVSSIEDICANTAELRSAEAKLISEIEDIAPVSRKEIKAQKALVKADNIALVAVQQDIDVASKNMARFVAYEQDAEALHQLTIASEKSQEDKAEVDAMALATANSNSASSLLALYTKYTATEKNTAIGTEALAKDQQKLEELKTKASQAEASIDNYSKKFIYLNAKEEELNKGMFSLIEKSYKEPKTYLVKEEVDSYYKDVDAEIAVIQQDLDATVAECDKRTAELASLQDKKVSLRNTASYRQTISDGAVIETELQASNDAIDNAMAKLQADKVAQSIKYDEHTALSKQITDMTAEQQALNSQIVGNYANYQEAVNADAVYKQALYGKHLTVSAYEVEISAIDKKIKAVDKTTGIYTEKLTASKEGKAQLDAHLSNLKAKLASLEEKFSHVAGEASLCALAEDLEYGSRCPICSGFVTSKADLGSQSTKAIETQIISVKEEIALALTKIESIQDSIGQYTAAKSVSANYATSLRDTKNSKVAIINSILAEYKVESVTELFNLLKKTIATSNLLTVNIDKYRNGSVLLNGMIEKNNEVVASYDKYTSSIATKQKELDALLASNQAIVDKYVAIQPELNGQNATDLVAKQHVINKEYEEIEAKQEALQAELANLEAHKSELIAVLNMLTTRSIDIDIKGTAFSYHDVVVRVIMSDLHKLSQGIVATAEEKEIIKLRIASLNKLLADTNAKIFELTESIASESSRLETQSAIATAIYSDYSEQISALGVNSVEELQALILPENLLEVYTQAVAMYQETVIRQAEANAILTRNLQENAPYYEDKEALTLAFDELKIKEFASIGKLQEDDAILTDMEDRYSAILKLNKDLSFLQERLQRIDEISPAITETTVLAKDFADLIFNKANSLVKNWSNDMYALIMKEDGRIALFNSKKGQEARVGKLNKEEKMLSSLALPLAYNSRVSDLLGFSLTPVMPITAEESDKNSLAVLVTSSAEQDIIVIPEDETSFMKSISRV